MNNTKLSNKNQNNYLKTPDFLSAVEVPLIQTTILAILKYPKTTNTKKIIMYLATATLITS